MNPNMVEAFNDQINFELYSSYLYLAMAAAFQDMDMPGAATWMRIQAQEELVHVMMMFNYVTSREGRVLLKTVQGPKIEWPSALAAYEEALAHEKLVTGRINKLMDLAIAGSDHASNQFLQWFVKEQVEEEANVKAIVQQLKLAGKEGQGLFMIDRELGLRTFVMPTGVTI